MAGRVSGYFAEQVESPQEYQARQLVARSRARGARLVSDATPGTSTVVSGLLTSITLCPVDGLATFEAELYDGSGRVTLLWMGRRRIAGIRAGTEVVARGRIVAHKGRLVIFNASYAIVPSD